MKRGLTPVLMLSFLLASILPAGAFENQTRFGKAKTSVSTGKITAGVRLHDEFPGLPELPVEKDDLSYELMYEYHEGIGLWQIGAGYMPGPRDDRFNYLITPQVNLIFKDRIYRLGSGIMKTYVESDSGSSWTDLYWQVIAGLGFSFGDHFGLDIYAHYVIENWKDIGDTDMAAVDYTAHLSISF